MVERPALRQVKPSTWSNSGAPGRIRKYKLRDSDVFTRPEGDQLARGGARFLLVHWRPPGPPFAPALVSATLHDTASDIAYLHNIALGH